MVCRQKSIRREKLEILQHGNEKNTLEQTNGSKKIKGESIKYY